MLQFVGAGTPPPRRGQEYKAGYAGPDAMPEAAEGHPVEPLRLTRKIRTLYPLGNVVLTGVGVEKELRGLANQDTGDRHVKFAVLSLTTNRK